jgi:hypothetical protein
MEICCSFGALPAGSVDVEILEASGEVVKISPGFCRPLGDFLRRSIIVGFPSHARGVVYGGLI